MDMTPVLLQMGRHLRTAVVVVEEVLLNLLVHRSIRTTLPTRIYRGEVVVVVAEAEEAPEVILAVAAEMVATSMTTVLAITDLLPVALVTQAEVREEVDHSNATRHARGPAAIENASCIPHMKVGHAIVDITAEIVVDLTQLLLLLLQILACLLLLACRHLTW